MRAITIALAVVVGFAGAELLHSFAAHADPTGKPTTLKEAKDAAAAKAAELAASKPCKSWEIGQQVVKLTNTDGKLLATGDGFEPFAVVTSPAVNAPDAIVLERRCAANW